MVKIDKNMAQQMKMAYDTGLSLREVANKFQVSHTTVKRYINTRSKSESLIKYSVNHNAFSTVDFKSSYWLGVLWSDGCLQKRLNSQDIIHLTSKDYIWLTKFRDFLKSNYKIRPQNNCYTFSFPSSKISTDIQEYGIMPAKSLIVGPPLIDEVYFCSFIRGFFDGDGSLYCRSRAIKNKVSNPACGLSIVTASKEFSNWLNEVCPNAKPISYLNGLNYIYGVRYSNFKDINNFCSWMYSNSDESCRLSRKYNKWTEILGLVS